MAQVAGGAPIGPSYIEHIGLCLACRGCESGLPFRRALRAFGGSGARGNGAQIQRPWYARWLRNFFFRKLLPSRLDLIVWEHALSLPGQRPEKAGARARVLAAKLRDIESLSPEIEAPFFFRHYGKTLAAEGKQGTASRLWAAAWPTSASRA